MKNFAAVATLSETDANLEIGQQKPARSHLKLVSSIQSKESKTKIEMLAEKAKAGDQSAFGELMRITEPKVRKSCYYLIQNNEVAEEICQHAFLKAYGSLNQLTEPKGFLSWVIRIAKNLYIDQIRSNKYSNQHVSIDDLYQSPSHLVADENRDDLLDVNRLLSKLKKIDRDTIVLVEMHGYSYLEAAEELEITEASVRSRIFRARKQLARLAKKRKGDKEDVPERKSRITG